jgi:glycosyltransferase involved in cell wall biosynthesis
MFPRFSETFILNEILELEHRGVKVVAFSLKEPDEALRQPAFERVRARIFLVPRLGWKTFHRFLAAHLSCLLSCPLRYLHTLDFTRRRGTRAAWSKFGKAPIILHLARRHGVEHFHAHFASGPARQAKLISMLSGIPFSFTAHAKDLFWEGHQHGKNNKLKKRVRMASFVVVISDFNRRFIESLPFRVPRRRLINLYNGLDLDSWTFDRPDGLPRDAGGSPPLILAVGRLVPKKGFDVLVEACRLLREEGRDFHCRIYGEGPEGKALRRQVAEAGLLDCVDLPGPAPQDELRGRHFPRAALLAQPSVIAEDGDQDGIPTVILEALAFGLPVVSTPVSGIEEAVVDGVTGLIAEAGNARSLAKGMARLLDRPELRGQLARGGRDLMELRFDLKKNVKTLIHLYEFSARGKVRWSTDKLRDKVGLEPLEDEPENREAEHAPLERKS